MAKTGEVYRASKYTIPKWNITVELVRVGRGLYVVFPTLCTEVGIKEPNNQVEKLLRKHDFVGKLRPLPIIREDSTRGAREMWCLARHMVATWLGRINPNFLIPELRGRVEELQADITALSDRLMWDDFAQAAADEDTPVPATLRGRVVTGHLYADCPQCGAHLCIELDGVQTAHVSVGVETGGE